MSVIPTPRTGVEIDKLTGPEDKIIEINGIKIRYIDQGYGNRTYVLLHGFGASVYSWRYLIPELSKNGRVIAFDRPGFGLSERKDPEKLGFNPYTSEGQVALLLSLLRELKVSKAIIIGHSAGGGLGLLFALKEPEYVERLVLIAPSWYPREKNWISKFLYELPIVENLGPLFLRLQVGKLEQILYKAWYNKTTLSEDVLNNYKYPLEAKDWDKGLYWVLKYSDFPDIKTWLGNLSCSILIIHGDKDEIVPLDSSIELANMVSKNTETRLIIIPEVGHLPHEETPELVIEVLLKFINN